MSRYLGPRLRIIRRLGYLIGLTRKKPSPKLLNPDARRGIRKVIPPGQHGRSKSFKKKPYESNEYDFLIRLKLKQRIRYHYGITEKQLVNYVRQARKIKGSTGRVLLRLLEMRLDNTVFRLHMAPTIRAARQLINHGHIYVNNKKIGIPSYSCKPKDIITPAPKKRSLHLLNNYLIQLDLEKSRFKNLLKILKFGKKGLLNNTKTRYNNQEKINQKNCKPNTIISLRIQRAGALEGQGIGFLGRNLVIVQPLFGNIKNYLGKSINICIYLKRENIFYGYPTKAFNIKMRYSKLINSIDAIQYFGRRKILQTNQNKESINIVKSNENDIKTIKNLNKSSSAIVLLGGANILRNQFYTKNQKLEQNYSDNILVRIEAASCGKNSKYSLNKKRQLNPFLLKKTRDTNPILFREKYLYSRKNSRFVRINHIFYVKMICKAAEQNSTNTKNFSSLHQKPQIENKIFTSISNTNSLVYPKLNKINQNNSKLKEKIINNEETTVSHLLSKNNYNPSLSNNVLLENSRQLRKYYFASLKKQNKFIQTKLSFLNWCLRKEDFENNLTKGQYQTTPFGLNFNTNVFSIKQKLLKSLVVQIAIQKNFNINYFWKAIFLFSKFFFKQNHSPKVNRFFNNSFKNNFLQTFSKMILDQQTYFSKKIYPTKAFLFLSRTFSLIQEWKSKTLIGNSFFQQFVKNFTNSLNFIIILQKSMILLLENKKQYSSFNIKSNVVLEYYKHQEYQILKNFQTKIQNEININKFEKLATTELLVSLNHFTKINQLRKILELNNIKQKQNLFLYLLDNTKLFNSNISYTIDILNYCKNYLYNQKFTNTFLIYRNYVQNKKNLMKKQLFKYRFELQRFINLLKKTALFSKCDESREGILKETGKKLNKNFFRKQILQKVNLIKSEFDFKKFLFSNFLKKWMISNIISYDQTKYILFKLNYYLSQEKYKKYENILLNIRGNKNTIIWNNLNFFNKIKNLIFAEKKAQKLLNLKLKYIHRLQEIQNLSLVFHLTKEDLVNSILNRINFLSKLMNFETNSLINKRISNEVKNKIRNENFMNINNNIYMTKLNSLLTLKKAVSVNSSNISNSIFFNSKKILQKIQQKIIEQKMQQKKEFLSISKKYENIFIKNCPVFNVDQNGKDLTNFIFELFDLKENKIFKKLDKTSLAFYPIEFNKNIVKQKIIEMSASWFNFIVLFNRIDKLYQENDITQNEYDILMHQVKQFIIKQLILNKNKSFIGYNNYLKLGQNNINYFINRIKNYYNIFNVNTNLEFFEFSFIQINQKYSQFVKFMTNKQILFFNQSLNNSLYINKLRKLNLVDNLNVDHSLSLKRLDKEVELMQSQEILNPKAKVENKDFEKVYSILLKDQKLRYKHVYQDLKFSSNIIVKLSIIIAKWIKKISIMKLKKGLNLLQKQQLITKPNFKLLISILLKFKQDSRKWINNILIFNSVLLFKIPKIYQQKRIQSFLNLLRKLNLSINYIKLNRDLKYSINKNVQIILNKKFYFTNYNQIVSNEKINNLIKKFVVLHKNKLQILKYFNIFDSSIRIVYETVIEKMANQIIQFNNLNISMDQISYTTTKFRIQTIKFCNMFIYYNLKYSKKRKKYFLLNDQTKTDYNEKNYLRDDVLNKLFSKFTILKQQNLLTFSKYQKNINQLKEQLLTKQLILNFVNEINLSKLEQLIDSKFINSDFIFYSKVIFFKFLTSLNILKKHSEIKQNEDNKFLNKIKIELTRKFQNEFQYFLYLSKYNSLRQNEILDYQQKNHIEKQLFNIINTIKNYSKRSIKLQQRLKYGFINYRKFETITQNLILNCKFKIRKIILNSQNEQRNNHAFLLGDTDLLLKLRTPSFSEKNQTHFNFRAFYKLNLNNFKNLKFNTSIKQVNTLQEIGLETLQKLMYFYLKNYKNKSLHKQNFEYNFFILNYLKKELQIINILNICQQTQKNSNYLKELTNQTKTTLISQTRKIYGNITKNKTQTTKSINLKPKAKIKSEHKKKMSNSRFNFPQSWIQNIKSKKKKNLLQKFKKSLIKQFLLKMKNIIFNNFNKNSSIQTCKQRLCLVENIFSYVENIEKNKINEKEVVKQFDSFSDLSKSMKLTTNTIINYLKNLQLNLNFSTLNLLDCEKYAFNIYQNNRSFKKNKNVVQLKLVSVSPEFKLLNLKIYNILKGIQKSYKYKILSDIQNKNNKIFNINRVQKLKLYDLYSVQNKKLHENQQIQEMYNKLENIFINSNNWNLSLIGQFLKFELNLLKKSQYIQQQNKYITKSASLLSNQLNMFKKTSILLSKQTYKQIKNFVLKKLLLNLLICPYLNNLKDLIKSDLISNKLYKKMTKFFYKKKFIAKLQNFFWKLKQNSFNDCYHNHSIFPKLILILEKLNDLKRFNLINRHQYNFLQMQMQQILKYEQYISRLSMIKKQGILTDLQYNQILLKIQQKIVQKVREQKIVQKFKQYIQYLYQTKMNNQSSNYEKNQQKFLNNKYKKIISLNQGKWALVAIKEFYEQNLLTTSQYNEIVQKIQQNITKKVQIAKLFSTNRNFSQLKLSTKIKWGLSIRQNEKKSKLLRLLPKIWTKNILKELRKQSIISNATFTVIEKKTLDDYYSKRDTLNNFLIKSSKKEFIKKMNISERSLQIKTNSKLLKKSIELLFNYKKQINNWLSIVEKTPINSDDFFDLSYLMTLKSNANISKKEYNQLKMYHKLATTRFIRLKTLQKAESLNNMQYEKIYKKIIKYYLITQYQYIQRLLRKKQSILQEISSLKNMSMVIDKKIKKHFNKIKVSKKVIKTSNSLFSLIQEVLAQLPISTTNKTQSTYRQRIIYNRLYSKLRSDEILIKKWKEILTTILKKQLTPPLDIPPHLELKRIQIVIIPSNITQKNKKNLIIPIGTVMSLPSRKTVGISVLERLIVEYYSRN